MSKQLIQKNVFIQKSKDKQHLKCEIPIIFSYSKFIDFLDDSRSILAVKIHVEKLTAQVQYYKLQAADMNKLLLDAPVVTLGTELLVPSPVQRSNT